MTQNGMRRPRFNEVRRLGSWVSRSNPLVDVVCANRSEARVWRTCVQVGTNPE